MLGVQSWIALPRALEETAQHFDAGSLPIV
jgi:hypothetical protein